MERKLTHGNLMRDSPDVTANGWKHKQFLVFGSQKSLIVRTASKQNKTWN